MANHAPQNCPAEARSEECARLSVLNVPMLDESGQNRAGACTVAIPAARKYRKTGRRVRMRFELVSPNGFTEGSGCKALLLTLSSLRFGCGGLSHRRFSHDQLRLNQIFSRGKGCSGV